MSRVSLLLPSLRYHWRTNLAVLLGVVAGTAVVGGALIVGDSVRGSLRDMTLVRLGKIDYALTGQRFVRESLASELADLPAFQTHFATAAPAIVLTASIEKSVENSTKIAARAGQISLYGLDDRLWELTDHGDFAPPHDEDVLLSYDLAHELNARVGESVVLSVELPSDIPRDALLGKRDDTALQIPLTVKAVLPEASGAGRLGLHPDQQLPKNAFVSLATLQDRLGLAARPVSRRDRRELPSRVNSLFVAARNSEQTGGEPAALPVDALNQALADALTLSDLHLRVVMDTDVPCLSVESERMILDRTVVAAADRIAAALGSPREPVLVSIANEISVIERGTDAPPVGAGESPSYSRYAVVAGVDSANLTDPDSKPFGPYTFAGPPPETPLGEGTIAQPNGIGEILINDWLAADLRAHPGDTVRLTYHLVGSHGELPEEERRFKVRGIVKLVDTLAASRGLTPEVRGITDVASFDDWDAPFPMKKVTARDDAYWVLYRATPKAFVTLSTAQHLWQSRYGDLTSLRIAAPPGRTLEETKREFTSRLLKELKPAEMGLAFLPVKLLGLQAASGTTDFGGLFFGFSFFLILSAAILIGLLFRLGIEQRAASVGLLLATGFSVAQVRRLLLAEGLIVVLAGVVTGLFAAALYAALMIYGLKTWWIGAIGTRFLDVHIEPASLVTGAIISIAVALGSVWWGLRGLWKISTRSLLAGVAEISPSTGGRHARRGRYRLVAGLLAGLALLATIAATTGLIPAVEAFAGFSWPTITFFLVGMAMLVAGVSLLAARLDADQSETIHGAGFEGIAQLGLRNAARNRLRSLLSTGLIASATFLIVAIAAGHRNPAVERPERNSGNGGFSVVAESSVPILYDLNTPEGRDKLGMSEDAYPQAAVALGRIIGFQVNPGENASCLNIYQTSQPTILGVPPEMIERGGFKFIGEGGTNPWPRLRESEADGAIPVFGDMNTLQYSLHVGPGATLELQDEFHRPVKVRIAGMLDGSVFQGVLLMDDSHFRRLFPSRVGAQYFLIETGLEQGTPVSEWLESQLPGFDAERVVDRLAGFLAVQNTYLSTFQALGGLGLLLGTIGLATVMLRNILDRRTELALLRAVGFGDRCLAWLVLCENALLLAWGLACGGASALLGMLPHLRSTGADVPWSDVAFILAAVFLTGMSASFAAVRGALRTPVLATLRGK
jgi:ABC-type lipoprotein release transport system permease subunit